VGSEDGRAEADQEPNHQDYSQPLDEHDTDMPSHNKSSSLVCCGRLHALDIFEQFTTGKKKELPARRGCVIVYTHLILIPNRCA
jgi:hypothetical protein